MVRASSRSLSVILRMNGPSSMRTARAGCVRTILPFSVPRYFSSPASSVASTRTTSATTAPLVPDDHDPGKPMSGSTCGSTRCALKRTSDQPLPKGNVSRWPLASPHSANFFSVQSAACLIPGPPVSRGPYTSLNQLMWSITCERFRPSSRILAIVARSTFSAGACARGNVTTTSINTHTMDRRFMKGDSGASYDTVMAC